MYPEIPLLQLVVPRLKSAQARLAEKIWSDVRALDVYFAPPSERHTPLTEARRSELKKVNRAPFHWGRLFDHCWFRVDIPGEVADTAGWLHWKDQGEATAYIDGVPWFGFDIAHRRCPLPKGARDVWVEGTCLQSAIWHPDATGLDPQGSRFEGAFHMKRDDVAWEVYHDFTVLFDLVMEEHNVHFPGDSGRHFGPGFKSPVVNATVLFRRLLRRMNDAVDALDTGGINGMRAVLKKIYREFPADTLSLSCILTGHAHIDLVWLWPERMAESKAVHTFATVNRLMDHYPEFRFSYSQTASYAAAEERSPELLKMVRQRIKEKRWEATGAMEVESDTLIACGEALARSFLVGQERFRRLRGSSAKVLWLPDVFGYAACLPQIMKQTGVDYFFTTKLTWGTVTRFPYSSFIWKGNDGSEVISHVTHEVGYNGTVNLKEIRAGSLAYRQSDIHDEYLAPTGYGDGGGGPTAEMCERARRIANLAGLPRTKWDFVEDFFDRLSSVRARLPVYRGELYLEYHRGVHSSHGTLKSCFRASERALQTWEAVRCVTGGQPLPEKPWQRMIFAQFHDYIPGSAIWEVYDEAYRELVSLTDDSLAAAEQDLTSEGGEPCLFNPLPCKRTFLLSDGKESRQVVLPPLSGTRIRDLADAGDGRSVETREHRLRNGLVDVRFDKKGRIVFMDTSDGPVELRGPAAGLVLFPDFPHAFEAWDIDRQALALGTEADGVAEPAIEESTPARGILSFHRKIGKQSEATVRYTLEAGSSVLKIEYDIDWQEEYTLLKAVFPTGYEGNRVRYGSPFGSTVRNQHEGQPQDEAMWENAGSRWVAVSDDGEDDGLFVVTEAKYGFSCRRGNLGVSLLRSVAVTGGDSHHARVVPPSLRRSRPKHRLTDIGRHRIHIAVGRYDARIPDRSNPAVLADTLFTPPLAYRGEPVASGFCGLENGGSLVPCWAKPVASGVWILRLHETLGRRGQAKLKLAEGWQATRVDLSEQVLDPHPVKVLPYRPYEILSVMIEKAR